MRYLISFLFLITLTISLACAKQATDIAVNTVPANPAPAPTSSTAPPHPLEVDHADDDAARITLEEAKKLFDAGKAFIVDARPEEAYKQEHIKGAVNITSSTLDARLKDLPKDKTIIVYCS
jgi:3-mercaptopyruvate sulfurtransferase SseA